MMGWRPSLGLVGGLHSARPKVVSRKMMAILWLGLVLIMARARFFGWVG